MLKTSSIQNNNSLKQEHIKIQTKKFIDEFVEKHAGENFKFRKGQREAIESIVDTYFQNGKKHYFLQAPTGSGKSIIGICVAYVLNRFGKTGYILASDLSLQDQYAEDFLRLKLDWGSVKGLDNYLCLSNGETHRHGNCRVRMEKLEEIKRRSCYATCPYFQARLKASQSSTSLLNYSYWLMHDFEEAQTMFAKRDFIICDEAHKLLDILQNFFAPKIDSFTEKNLQSVREFLSLDGGINVAYSSQDIHELVNGMYEVDPEQLYINMSKFTAMLENIAFNGMNYKVELKKKDFSKLSKWEKKHMKIIDDIIESSQRFGSFLQAIGEVGINYMIPCKNDIEVSFKTIKENYLTEKYFHSRHGFSLMMSATLGAPKTFYKNILGSTVNGAKSFVMPSTFNFDNSPIYVYPGHSMSYKKKEESIGWIAEKIDEIIESHKGQRGIIHCGSFEMGNRIKSLLKNKSRVIMYQPGNKAYSLCDFEDIEDAVLMGPSILEGINLEDDKSRFQIFAKVPFASLADDFISSKLKLKPEWYQQDAIIKILQGVGRSVRNEHDWAITYMLDSDFIQLWKRNQEQFPAEFNNRLVFKY